jgi:hypothetical protein
VFLSWLTVGRVGMEQNLANSQSTKKHNTYQLLYIYSIPPDDGLQICPKRVEVDWRNKLRINSASSWFSLHRCYQDARATNHKILSLSSEVVKKWHKFPNYMDGRILIFFNKPRTDMKYAIQPQSVIIFLIMRSTKGTFVTCTHVWERF